MNAVKTESNLINTTIVNRIICEGMAILVLLLAMFLQLINLLFILYIRWKMGGFGKLRWFTWLLVMVVFPTWGIVGIGLIWAVFLLADALAGINFLLGEIYIAEVPPVTSINQVSFWERTSVVEYIGYYTILVLICLILYSNVPRSRVGLIYLFIAIVGVGMNYFASITNLNILLENYYMVAHSHMYDLKYMIILGGLSVLYQLILSNEQTMRPWLSYLHLVIFVLGFLWIINNKIPVSTDESFWKFRKKELFVIYILLLIGQFSFMINYGIALLNNKKAPA
ncbi:hypothetical protein QNI16_01985 [Cytophagaceae bacterium YF14B1]|uniref:Uncharacterized protein n=1 Tax=Xanthocytophaga flava TaxID=3048013 RepID=A0AAE3U3Y7_9BACT|nr:hypothetical protein [Xanthocytophaga flavus]MDJ1479234.1 hypothetical protein [Xanthocytophaga flavus]